MNRLILNVLLPVMLLAAAPTAMAQAKVGWVEQDHDFGVIYEADGLATCRFGMINTGTQPLSILDVRVNCGCTTPIYDHAPLAPGDTTWVQVSFDPTGRAGRFDKKVLIDTNTEPRQSTLRIRGSIIASEATLAARYPYLVGPARMKARFLPFGNIDAYESRGNFIEGYNTTPDTIYPHVDNPSDLLKIRIQPEVVPPGQQYIYSVVINADKRGHIGPQNAIVTLYPDRGTEDKLDLEVSFNIMENFAHLTPKQLQEAPVIVVDNRSIDFGNINANATEPLTATVVVTNRGIDPLKVRRIYSPDRAVTATIKDTTVKKDKKTTLTVTVDPAMLCEALVLNTSIDLITNDPVCPVLTLRVVGLVN